MRIDIEELRKMRERRREINDTPLQEIEYYFNGEKVTIPDDLVEEWKYMGLSNVDFDRYMLEGSVIPTDGEDSPSIVVMQLVK